MRRVLRSTPLAWDHISLSAIHQGSTGARSVEGYWRKVPNIKRLTIKSVPEESTRLAMMKKGEADFAAAMQGEIAEDVKRDPKLAPG